MTKLIHFSMTFDVQFELMRENMAQEIGWELVDEFLNIDQDSLVFGKDALILSD